MFPGIDYTELPNTDNEAATMRAERKKRRKRIAILHTINVCIVVFTIAAYILSWIIYCRFNFAKEHGRGIIYNFSYWPFPIEPVIMLLGLMFLATAFAIIHDLAICLSLEDDSSHQDCLYEDLSSMDNEETMEMKTTYEVIAKIFLTVNSLVILCWGIYAGFLLLTEPRRDNEEYNRLAYSTVVVYVVFSLIYFIIGLVVFNKLVQDLSGRVTACRKKGNWLSMS